MRRASGLAAVALTAAAIVVWAAVEQVRVVEREARVRATKRKFGDAVFVLREGDVVDVLATEDPWLRVARDGREGWLHESAVTRKRDYVFSTAALTRGREVEASQRTAGQKGFDSATETGYRASRPQLEAAYRQVDALDANPPNEARLARFVAEGELGAVR